MANIQPYTIAVPQDSIDRLKQKLSLTTFPDELDDAGWSYGAPLGDIKRLTKYWLERYDWREQEARLNKLPQFQTPIEIEGYGSLNVHFIHQKSPVAGAIPLLFVHGWPGCFIEVTKLLPLLTNSIEGQPSFHVVAPSLPNFGLSDGVKKKGFTVPRYAEVCHKLMQKLGYKEYVTQGGDWGFYITRSIGIAYPDHCKASHTNFVRANPPTFSKSPILAVQHALQPYTPKEKAGFERTQLFQTEMRGYFSEQSTRPQTLGYALADSPVGLLAWIYEKLHDWTDDYPFTEDEILTWISIYLFSTAGPTASLRIYYESVHDKEKSTSKTMEYVPGVKLGLALFPKELYVSPKIWGRTLGPVVYENEHDKGGHFAAYERPEAIAGDLRKMFGKGGGAYGVVSDKSGF